MKPVTGPIVGVVPAAGIGKRMRPFTKAVPKPLLPYGNKPVIHHILEMFRESDISDVLMVVPGADSPICQYVGDGFLLGLKVSYVFQEQPLGVGHALLCAKEWIDRQPRVELILQVNGDRIVNPPQVLADLVAAHQSSQALSTFLVTRVSDPSSYGLLQVDPDSMQVVKIVEKPTPAQQQRLRFPDGRFLVSGGVYVHSIRLLSYLSEAVADSRTKEVQFVEAIKHAMIDGHIIRAVELDCKPIDFGTPFPYLRAQWELFRSLKEKDIERMSKEWVTLGEK